MSCKGTPYRVYLKGGNDDTTMYASHNPNDITALNDKIKSLRLQLDEEYE